VTQSFITHTGEQVYQILAPTNKQLPVPTSVWQMSQAVTVTLQMKPLSDTEEAVYL